MNRSSASFPSEKRVYWQKFGDFLRQERTRRKFTAKEVANYLKIDPAHLAAYEKGEKEISLEHIYSLSNCLSINPNLICSILALYPSFPSLASFQDRLAGNVAEILIQEA